MRDWLIYPGMSRQDWGLRLRWWRKPSIFVLHSTEGGGWPDYSAGKSAPHFTVNCPARASRQHVPLSSAARALRSPILGARTNTGGAIQFEIIGTCAGTPGIPSVLDLDDGDLAYLAGLLREVADETGIPLTTSVVWSAYPASYGNWSGRLGWLAWWKHRGVVGHQHVPGNSHGDPGSLDISTLLDLAYPTPDAEDPFMALTDSEQREILDAARHLKPGGQGDRFVHEIPARTARAVAASDAHDELVAAIQAVPAEAARILLATVLDTATDKVGRVRDALRDTRVIARRTEKAALDIAPAVIRALATEPDPGPTS